MYENTLFYQREIWISSFDRLTIYRKKKVAVIFLAKLNMALQTTTIDFIAEGRKTTEP